VRIYWPWWMFPVAFAVWFVGAMVRLAAWPFRVYARSRYDRLHAAAVPHSRHDPPSSRHVQ
jgi:hypothetical protein